MLDLVRNKKKHEMKKFSSMLPKHTMSNISMKTHQIFIKSVKHVILVRVGIEPATTMSLELQTCVCPKSRPLGERLKVSYAL